MTPDMQTFRDGLMKKAAKKRSAAKSPDMAKSDVLDALEVLTELMTSMLKDVREMHRSGQMDKKGSVRFTIEERSADGKIKSFRVDQ